MEENKYLQDLFLGTKYIKVHTNRSAFERGDIKQ